MTRFKVKDTLDLVMFPDENGDWVRYEDYKEMADYADRLVEFGKLPCLPADLDNLREANLKFAMENDALKKQLADVRAELIRMTL